jgi:hypothetical protein
MASRSRVRIAWLVPAFAIACSSEGTRTYTIWGTVSDQMYAVTLSSSGFPRMIEEANRLNRFAFSGVPRGTYTVAPGIAGFARFGMAKASMMRMSASTAWH